MLVITVARKPLDGTVAANSLRWGTGSLNIDKTRIALDDNVNLDAVQRQGAQSAVYFGGAKPGDVIAMYKPGGRWPANLILSHLPGCSPAGTQMVKSSGHYPASRGTGGLGTSGHKGQSNLENRVLHKEEVTAWQCEDGCPVFGLDKQSGPSSSPTKVVRGGKRGLSFGMGRQDDVPCYGDTGGAARYFKQVVPSKEMP